MAADIRALILEELDTILAGVATHLGHNYYYNRGSFATNMRPCIVLLDGVEENRLFSNGRGRRALSLMLVTLKPEIFGLLTNEEPKNDGQSAKLSAMRLEIIRAIAASDNLIALVGANGDVVYNGCETDFQNTGTMDGKIQMNFEFVYVLNPYEP